MMTALLAITGAAGQMALWMIFARVHYKWWWLDEDEKRSGSRQEACLRASVVWGFLWPVLLLVMLAYGAIALPRWAVQAPSLKERRETRRKARRERLRDLDAQIKQAERELEEVTRTHPEPGTETIS
jgi:type VI protein secretion system component VasK